MSKGLARKSWLLLLAVAFAFVVAACGNNNAGEDATQGSEAPAAAPAETPATEAPANEPAAEISGEIKLDGSSTVYPVAQAVAEEFMNIHGGVNVTVGLSGSSNGIKAIINGEADIANASRLIKDSEVEQIKAKGDDVVEMPVAYDGITVVIHPENDWATEMTVEELKKIWVKDSTVKTWADVREGWPNEPITLFAPGAASGTFEYFTEAVNGEAKVAREDVTASEDDNVLVQGVAGDKYAMSYFGFAYYEENMDKLKAVAIKETADAPAILPSLETIGDFSYKPLSRFIYMYPLKSTLERPEIQEFVKYYMSDEGSALAGEVGYVPLDKATRDANLALLPQ
ncbi:PstS family phosphate ABC transporter substrate-binding protein [Paenibacillus antri]|uniref:Phosphate-binding protein n=1 Tax=Paenibacillus antri TaxID=2582848 RepID=A0A5R9FWK9_9BACL|nr:PstS family phosphate ABC transporter substrate-binding protein [Paenibacillus antri]TLS48432.1 PstS family phosphate ABC transporter substrate-binding protein [Paenibacillus antri]